MISFEHLPGDLERAGLQGLMHDDRHRDTLEAVGLSPGIVAFYLSAGEPVDRDPESDRRHTEGVWDEIAEAQSRQMAPLRAPLVVSNSDGTDWYPSKVLLTMPATDDQPWLPYKD